MTDLERELWEMLGAALSLARPSNAAEREKLDQLSNRYGFICDEEDIEQQLSMAA